MNGTDLSFLDQPWILSLIFYPRRDHQSEPRDPNATNHFIEIEDGVSIGCRFYLAGKENPTILYFHGNGETVCDYDYIAPLFNRIGINLFVTDYRGYGLSGGKPTVTNMVNDSHILFKGFREILKKSGYNRNFFIMGRSLGSISGIELASSYPEETRGLIIESGFAGVFKLLSRFNINLSNLKGEERFDEKIKKIDIPAMVIHAQNDHLIPLFIGKEIYNGLPSKDKRLVVIPGADHNDLMLVGMDLYFKEIRDFVIGHL
ncbi:MAG: alpha/beta hydrolase [Halobacteriota archaeon]|nr:alpha/beta hydrolase [Halobacteriota archaeon]